MTKLGFSMFKYLMCLLFYSKSFCACSSSQPLCPAVGMRLVQAHPPHKRVPGLWRRRETPAVLQCQMPEPVQNGHLLQGDAGRPAGGPVQPPAPGPGARGRQGRGGRRGWTRGGRWGAAPHPRVLEHAAERAATQGPVPRGPDVSRTVRVRVGVPVRTPRRLLLGVVFVVFVSVVGEDSDAETVARRQRDGATASTSAAPSCAAGPASVPRRTAR